MAKPKSATKKSPSKTSKPATGDADAKAKVLLKAASPTLPKDQVKPIKAALDAVELAKSGTLSAQMTREVWATVATTLVWPTSDKARKLQLAELGPRGYPTRHALILDCCKRYFESGEDDDNARYVARIYHSTLWDTDAHDEAVKIFNAWTPKFLKMRHEGEMSDLEVFDTWFWTHIAWLKRIGRDAEAKKLEKQLAKEQARV